MKTYDIINAGPNNRFKANGRIVSNSGSIVQLQNLFRNSLPDLEEARSLVKRGDYDALAMLYNSVPEVLAQCVRTAFVPARGMKFIVADFSSIEARVLSWVAGEHWKLEAFREGKDIYCETASRMFHVKVEKHGENAEYRQRGKQAELSCIAEGQLVLTDKGLVPIESVRTDMRVWDGEEWVCHEGVIYRGEREVIEYDGLTATPDHLVYENRHLCLFGDFGGRIKGVRKVYDLVNAGRHHRFTVSGKLVHNCGYGGSVGALRAMGALEAGMKEEELQPLVEAWRKANPRIVKLWADVEEAAKTAVKEKTTTRTHGLVFTYRGGMLYITLPSGRHLSYVKPRIGENRYGGEGLTYMGNDFTRHWSRIDTFGGKLVENCLSGGTLVITDKGLVPIECVDVSMRVWDGQEYVSHNGVVYQGRQAVMSYEGLTATPDHEIYIDDQRKEPIRKLAERVESKRDVYDILNAGPRHRFGVWNGERALIVSNCVQGISRDLLCHAMEQLRDMRIVAHIHDEIVLETPMNTRVEDVCEKMARVPLWADGLVLRADGYECRFYRKD